jgi:hypothetical protein
MDATQDTNKEKWPLFTITARDSTGAMFTVARAFLPNERAWVFRWLFQVVLPSLLGHKWLQHVQVIITDGDSQETSQLDIAMAKFFPQAHRVRCGWHIVDRGLKRYGPCKMSASGADAKKKYDLICRTVKLWLYSWMRPGYCESKEEYSISKALLMSYLNNVDVVDAIGIGNSTRIMKFIREHVEPLEEFYCFYLRRHLRHYDTYYNTSHEGTNNSIKSCAAPTLPQFTIERSATVLTMNAARKCQATAIKHCHEATGSKLWSALPTSQYLTTLAESPVSHEWERRIDYSSCCINSDTFHVVYMPSNEAERLNNGPIP